MTANIITTDIRVEDTANCRIENYRGNTLVVYLTV